MNEKVKRAARAAGVPLWVLARELGFSEATMTRRLREPLEAEQEQRMLALITELEERGARTDDRKHV